MRRKKEERREAGEKEKEKKIYIYIYICLMREEREVNKFFF